MKPSPGVGRPDPSEDSAACPQAAAWSDLQAAAVAWRGPPGQWRGRFVPDFRVIDETADYLVVDKPAPLQVHPAKPGGPPTLLDGLHDLLAYEIINGARLSIINRLDRETSGLVLIAKHRDAARVFGKAMMRRQIDKTYLALVHGWPERDHFTIEAPLRRLGEVEPTPVYLLQGVHPGGAPSRTDCRVLRRWERPLSHASRFALVEAHPHTGRMHQIRVHLAHIGHPIVGDKLYGPHGPTCYLKFIDTGWTPALAAKLLFPRHALHSSRLAMETETLGTLAWESAPPAEFIDPF